ncbi:NADH-ubiquinone oxidoreductase chain 3 [Rhododendron vialii]|uniref:NADH-ubiquinone oxidoreductase chain 3 n=1 Tax=Rhododendron vialii TaxID=182163 RepID=UPI00265F9C70|nr:NADH-ubiquinone oxidoreductase chain 3 [Rhododendron vialii]
MPIFGDARSRFDIRFYLVSFLFIIFDLEVNFFFPWAVSPNKMDLFGFWSMMVFLLILTIGFLYEWKRGALDWELALSWGIRSIYIGFLQLFIILSFTIFRPFFRKHKR